MATSTSQLLPAATFLPAASPPPPPCRFRFGAFFRGADTLVEPHDYGGIDYLCAWIGQRDAMNCPQPPCFNPYWHGAMLQLARERGLSVAYYAYIIAFLAKATGLLDCDVGEPSLCQRGAMFIRENKHLILRTYARFANETARVLGRSAEVLFLMEPDWHQYHADTQQGGGLRTDEMVDLFQLMVTQIRHFLPRARISLDISPWVPEQGPWLTPFLQSCTIDFLHTAGGRTSAASELIRANDRGNTVRWADVHRISGLGIIADAGYGVAGVSQGLDAAWDDPDNLRNRIADGVVAVTQADPGEAWGAALAPLRRHLPRPRVCDWTDPTYAPPPSTTPVAAQEARQVRRAARDPRPNAPRPHAPLPRPPHPVATLPRETSTHAHIRRVRACMRGALSSPQTAASQWRNSSVYAAAAAVGLALVGALLLRLKRCVGRKLCPRGHRAAPHPAVRSAASSARPKPRGAARTPRISADALEMGSDVGDGASAVEMGWGATKASKASKASKATKATKAAKAAKATKAASTSSRQPKPVASAVTRKGGGRAAGGEADDGAAAPTGGGGGAKAQPGKATRASAKSKAEAKQQKTALLGADKAAAAAAKDDEVPVSRAKRAGGKADKGGKASKSRGGAKTKSTQKPSKEGGALVLCDGDGDSSE